MIESRNIARLYAYTVSTSGLYGLFWLGKMARDVGVPYRVHANKVMYLATVILAAVLAYKISNFDSTASPEEKAGGYMTAFRVVAGMVLIIYSIAIYYVCVIANFCRAKGQKTPCNLVMSILTVLWFIAFPMLQNRLNQISKNGNLTSQGSKGAPRRDAVTGAPAWSVKCLDCEVPDENDD